jgi:uncharacterized protein DUF5655
MPTRVCYHCKQTLEEGDPHDCWTTTEAALTRELSDDLHDAWERLRESAAALGEQRIYASHKSIMFSRRACYFFVRPKKQFLEVCMFLGRRVSAPQVRRSSAASSTKIAHILHIQHRDQVEAPVTTWLEEAYEWSGLPRAEAMAKLAAPTSKRRGAAARKTSAPQRAGADKATAKTRPARKKQPAARSSRTRRG